MLGFVHGRVTRDAGGAPFTIPLRTHHLQRFVSNADELRETSPVDGSDLRVDDADYAMSEHAEDRPLAETRAPRYRGSAKDIVTARLGLATEDWMQDWPLEVSDAGRIDEFIAFYDEVDDDAARFDIMSLVLYSCEERMGEAGSLGTAAAWLAATLRRNFALHAHTIRYWAILERAADDPELRAESSDYVFPISGLLRSVWDDALRPIEVAIPHLVPRSR